MPLVGEVGETNVAGQFAADNILHISGSLSHSLGVFGANGLGHSGSHGVAALNKGRFLFAADWGRPSGGGHGGVICWGCRGGYIIGIRISITSRVPTIISLG